ncbi:SoxR reducing system RseC family protein [Chitinibacteraceae bacterium HSL-7]
MSGSTAPAPEHEVIAWVERLDGAFAWVRPEARALCARCAPGGRCQAQSLSRMFASSEQLFRVRNDAGARPEMRVIVALPVQALKSAIWRGYALPLAGLMAGALLVSPFGNPAAVLGAVFGGALGFGIARWRTLAHPAEPRIVGVKSNDAILAGCTKLTSSNHNRDAEDD